MPSSKPPTMGAALRSDRDAVPNGRYQRVIRRWLCGRRLDHESEDYSEEYRRHEQKPHKLPHDSSFHTEEHESILASPRAEAILRSKWTRVAFLESTHG